VRRVLVAILAAVIPFAVAGGFVFALFRFAAPRPIAPSPSSSREGASPAFAPSATLAPTATLLPTDTPQPTAAPTASPQPTSLSTMEPSATRSPTPQPTATATQTEIPPTPDLRVYGEVVAFALNLRSGPPGTDYLVLRALRQGDRLEIIAQTVDGFWLRVTTADGTAGWVSSEHLAIPEGAVERVPVDESPA
jgi:hypothetical protein